MINLCRGRELNTVSNPKFDILFLKQLYLLAKLPRRLINLKRKKAFDKFSKKHINTGLKLYKNNEELKKDLPKADAYICGSDQIWNSFFENGKDPAFYLDFVPDVKLKISYAASFAIDEIKDDLKPFVKEKVNRINHVSVRETSGIKILNNLGIENVVQVVDPVFLVEKDFWVTNFVIPILDNYIFVYDCDSNKNIQRIVKETAKKYKLKIYTVNQNIKYASKNFYKSGPETFLSLIYGATFVISNSFHAVAFSLIFNKLFFVVDRNEKINTRMRDIMNYVGLPELHLKENQYKKFENITIDYISVNKIIQLKIKESQEFLINALN